MSIWPRPMQREVPITDPRWLVSTQEDRGPEEECETEGCTNLAPGWDVLCTEHTMERFGQGLDGNGTTSAADLPARTAEGINVWDTTWPQRITEELDMEQTEPIKRVMCLLVDPDGDYLMPGRCKKPLGHEEPHDWGANHGAFLGETRRAELATPSGMLPRRTPGAALGDAEGECGSTDADDAPRPADRVLGRWVC